MQGIIYCRLWVSNIVVEVSGHHLAHSRALSDPLGANDLQPVFQRRKQRLRFLIAASLEKPRYALVTVSPRQSFLGIPEFPVAVCKGSFSCFVIFESSSTKAGISRCIANGCGSVQAPRSYIPTGGQVHSFSAIDEPNRPGRPFSASYQPGFPPSDAHCAGHPVGILDGAKAPAFHQAGPQRISLRINLDRPRCVVSRGYVALYCLNPFGVSLYRAQRSVMPARAGYHVRVWSQRSFSSLSGHREVVLDQIQIIRPVV